MFRFETIGLNQA